MKVTTFIAPLIANTSNWCTFDVAGNLLLPILPAPTARHDMHLAPVGLVYQSSLLTKNPRKWLSFGIRGDSWLCLTTPGRTISDTQGAVLALGLQLLPTSTMGDDIGALPASTNYSMEGSKATLMGTWPGLCGSFDGDLHCCYCHWPSQLYGCPAHAPFQSSVL